MKKGFLLVGVLAFLVYYQSNAQQKKQTVTVYTTAKGTNMRLSESGVLTFKQFKQPKETEPTIFLDTTHSFQSFIGIGGALTDAAAETFAKLPTAVQQEL